MLVPLSTLHKDQTVTVTREGRRLGFGRIVELKHGHIILTEKQRGGTHTQLITLDGREQYTLHA